MKKIVVVSLAIVATMLFRYNARADLHILGVGDIVGAGGVSHQLIYDDVLDITWLDFTHPRFSSGDQMDWASGLEVVFNGRVFGNWRLPGADESRVNLTGPWEDMEGRPVGWGYKGPDETGHYDYYRGHNMFNSEMGHLFYESLENKGVYAADGTERPFGEYGLDIIGPFTDLKPAVYWTGTGYSEAAASQWYFVFFDGYQGSMAADDPYYALAVHPGDVSAVPIPGAVWLLGSAFFGLVSLRVRLGK